MKELVAYVARSLVDNKDAVTVEETVGPEATILELHVAPEDMGKVIGKQGRIAKAIRAVVRAATAKDQPWCAPRPPRTKSPYLLRFSNLFRRIGRIGADACPAAPNLCKSQGAKV